MCIMKFCNFACLTFRWLGIKGHISSYSNRPHSDTVGNTIMPRLTLAQRNNAIGRLQAGATQQAVARHFAVSRQTMSALWERYNTTQSVNDRSRSGRPRVTTAAQDRYIRVCHLRNRTTTATTTATQIPGLRRISDQTVRNRLREAGIVPRRPVRRNVLTPRHLAERMQWCQQRVRWTRARWRTVLFSDESRFLLSRADGRTRVYRRRGERYAPNCVQQVDRFGGGSVMVWAGIHHGGRTALVHVAGTLTGIRYRDEILQHHVIPHMNVNGGMFQHDNARPHVARVNQEFLQRHNVPTLPWPARSPDLNPIEHLWDALDQRVRRRHPPPQTLPELLAALQNEWQNIPQRVVDRLIASMRRRCQAVIRARGGHNRY